MYNLKSMYYYYLCYFNNQMNTNIIIISKLCSLLKLFVFLTYSVYNTDNFLLDYKTYNNKPNLNLV